MGRATRWLFTLFSALSLLLSAACAVLWWRSWHDPPGDEDRYSWLISTGERLTLRSDAGRLTLFQPPAGNLDVPAKLTWNPKTFEVWEAGVAPTGQVDPRFRLSNPPAVLPTAREALAALRNSDILWGIFGFDNPDSFDVQPQFAYSYLQYHTPAWFLTLRTTRPRTIAANPFSPADATSALLIGLENSDQFLAAHMLLQPLVFTVPIQATERATPAGTDVWTAQFDGLQLRLLKPLQEDTGHGFTVMAVADPSHLPRIREQWHRRLDVQKSSVAYWQLTAATAIPPLLWIAARVRRRLICRSRMKTGRCVSCGYDLRGSAGRCPECGVLPAGVQDISHPG